MIWLYERGPDVLRIETRYDNESAEFELIWHRPDGTTESERFASEVDFRARLEVVEASLRNDQWNINGSPQLQAEGWKDGTAGAFKLH